MGKSICFPYRYTGTLPVLSPVFLSASQSMVLFSCQNGKEPLQEPSLQGHSGKGTYSIINALYSLKTDGSIDKNLTNLTTDVPVLSSLISFPKANSGVILASENGKFGLYQYTGTTKKFTRIAQENWMNHVVHVQFMNQSTGYLMTADAVYETSDGGRHWTSHKI